MSVDSSNIAFPEMIWKGVKRTCWFCKFSYGTYYPCLKLNQDATMKHFQKQLVSVQAVFYIVKKLEDASQTSDETMSVTVD